MNTMPMGADTTSEVVPAIAGHDIIRQIGEGGYGKVWLVRNRVTGAFRAAKVITRKALPDERSFQRELDGIRNFDPISSLHPGLVTILHVGEDKEAGYYYYVMELADDAHTGQTITPDTYRPLTLKEEMANHPRLAISTKLQIALSLTSALGFIHEKGLIHRDIKPSNIIFVNGMPKIADIGLITEAGEDASRGGTIYYMPPVEGPGKPTADIFSLGKVFYELFMGMHPKDFPELPGEAEEFTSVPELLRINNLILKACHHDPRQRFQTAKELYRALQAVAGTVQERTDVGTTEKPISQSSKPGDPLSRPTTVNTKNTTGSERRSITSVEQQSQSRWTRRDALLVLLSGTTVGAFFLGRLRQSDSVGPQGATGNTDPVIVLIDTIAQRGIYEESNKIIGRSNTKDLYDIIKNEIKEVPPENIAEYSVGLDWDRRSRVILQRPALVVIHRSVFFHPVAAALHFLYPDEIEAKFSGDPARIDAEKKEFDERYKILGDNKLREFLSDVGTAEPRTKFLVYSRGTDPKWLSNDYRRAWTKEVETQYPLLKGRVETMLITREKKGSFRNVETREELVKRARQLLGLPEKREPENTK